MTDKNVKLKRASRLGMKIEVWTKIANVSRAVNDIAKQKIEEYSLEQDDLIVDVAGENRFHTLARIK